MANNWTPETADWDAHSEPPSDERDAEVLAVETLTARLADLTALYQDIANQLEPEHDPFS